MRLIVIALLALATFSNNSQSASNALPAAHSFSLAPSAWAFQYSPGLTAPNAAPQGFQFNFPVYDHQPTTDCAAATCPSVHYLTTSAGARIVSSSVRLAATIATVGDPVFQYKLKPDNICDAPAAAALYFQRAGDNMSGAGAYEFYRWFSTDITIVLTPGAFAIELPLKPTSVWVSVFGRKGDDKDPAVAAGFISALANVDRIGMTFGGGCFKGHGVNPVRRAGACSTL